MYSMGKRSFSMLHKPSLNVQEEKKSMGTRHDELRKEVSAMVEEKAKEMLEQCERVGIFRKEVR